MIENLIRITSPKDLTEGLHLVLVLEVRSVRIEQMPKDGDTLVVRLGDELREVNLAEVPAYLDLSHGLTHMWAASRRPAPSAELQKRIQEALEKQPQAPAPQEGQQPAPTPNGAPGGMQVAVLQPIKPPPPPPPKKEVIDVNLQDWVEEDLEEVSDE